MSVSAKEITACLMANLRFTKQFPVLATEVGAFNSDVLAIDPRKHRFTEIEVKVSKNDLMADFKKFKHEYILHRYVNKGPLTFHNRQYRYYDQFVPKQFFFCVPDELEEYALSALEDFPYGLMVFTGRNRTPWMHRVKIIKKAARLHNEPITDMVIQYMQMRMSSELANFHLAKVKAL